MAEHYRHRLFIDRLVTMDVDVVIGEGGEGGETHASEERAGSKVGAEGIGDSDVVSAKGKVEGLCEDWTGVSKGQEREGETDLGLRAARREQRRERAW